MSAYDTHLLEIFTAIVALSLLLQSLALFGIYKSIRAMASRIEVMSLKLSANVDLLSGKVETLLSVVQGMADGVRTLQENLTSTSAIIKKRIEELDSFAAEITSAARLQVLRVQDVVDTASRRVEETIDLLQDSVVAPITEANAVIRGIKVAIDVLLRRRRPSSSAPQDEEMFI